MVPDRHAALDRLTENDRLTFVTGSSPFTYIRFEAESGELLPPIVQRMVERQVVLERRVASLERLLEASLEALSQPKALDEVTG